MANVTDVVTSHNCPNYSGMLFNKGNTRTPFSSLIGGRTKTTNHFQFVIGQEYESLGGSSSPAISEAASLTAPTPSFITRQQRYNVTQAFHESVSISYIKQSDMGTLGGLNFTGQQANPANELDFQVAARMTKIARDIEYTFINGVYNLAGSDDEVNQTRGMLNAITTNTIDAGGKGLGLWLVADVIKSIYEANGDVEGTVLWLDATSLYQLNADAADNGLTIVPNAREINGIKLSSLLTPLGEVYLRLGECMPGGTVMVINPRVIAPVEQGVPGKGNFFLEPLSKTGAKDSYQIFGQIGLDHGPEWMHGKITGLSTSFTAPTGGRKVYVTGPVATVETAPNMVSVVLGSGKAVVGGTVTATPVLDIAPSTPGTFTYSWESSDAADGTFAEDSSVTGYNTATITVPAEVPAKKYIRCKVTASGSVAAGALYSDVIEIVAE